MVKEIAIGTGLWERFKRWLYKQFCKRCEMYKVCPYYSSEGYTCEKGDDERCFCGMYEKLCQLGRKKR